MMIATTSIRSTFLTMIGHRGIVFPGRTDRGSRRGSRPGRPGQEQDNEENRKRTPVYR